MHFITELRTGNVQFEASQLKVLYETAIMAEEMIVGMWPTILHLLSPKQHSMMRLVRIPHIDTKRKPLTKAGRPIILVHVVAMYDAFQAVLGFLCRRVLQCVLDVHTRVDAFNGMIRECTKNLVIRRTLVIKHIIFCCDHL